MPVKQKTPGDKGNRSSSSRRLSTQDLECLSARQCKRLRTEQHEAYLEHPYKVKLDLKKSKLLKIMNDIFQLADNDLIVCDFDTGLNDYSKNLKFADNLDVISKELTVLSKECSDKANAIRDRIAQAKEDKRLIQDIVFQTEIVKDAEKCDEITKMWPSVNYIAKDFVHTHDFRIKCERPILLHEDSTTDSENNEPVKSGDPDTKFRYAKNNDFDETRHPNSICVECDKVCRDQHELRNHMSNHHKELYRCMKCGNLS